MNCVASFRWRLRWYDIMEVSPSLCVPVDPASLWGVHAGALPCRRPSAQRDGAHLRALPLPGLLFPPPGVPAETLWGGGAGALPALPGPHAQRRPLYPDHAPRDTPGSGQPSCTPLIGPGGGGGSTPCASPATAAPDTRVGGGRDGGSRSAPTSASPAVGRSSGLRRHPWCWAPNDRTFSLLGYDSRLAYEVLIHNVFDVFSNIIVDDLLAVLPSEMHFLGV